jgi:hypothetical protein
VRKALLTAQQGGHANCVQALVAVNQFLFSADWEGTIKVGLSSSVLVCPST